MLYLVLLSKGELKMMGHHKGVICWIAGLLVLIGGLNWGFVGLFNMNLVALIFGHFPIVEKVIYILVGASALLIIIKMIRHKCGPECVHQKMDGKM
jgi:uncharacterized membrane protein YuzA (DUF378 family)